MLSTKKRSFLSPRSFLKLSHSYLPTHPTSQPTPRSQHQKLPIANLIADLDNLILLIDPPLDNHPRPSNHPSNPNPNPQNQTQTQQPPPDPRLEQSEREKKQARETQRNTEKTRMCLVTHYRDFHCGHHWAAITTPCFPGMGFDNCPSFFEGRAHPLPKRLVALGERCPKWYIFFFLFPFSFPSLAPFPEFSSVSTFSRPYLSFLEIFLAVLRRGY